jgi:hypothetical protein
MHSKRAHSLRLAGLSLAAAATTLTGQVALAQGREADALEEVVVTTARQRSEALQDVPASPSQPSRLDTLEAANVAARRDFVNQTPGVSIVHLGRGGRLPGQHPRHQRRPRRRDQLRAGHRRHPDDQPLGLNREYTNLSRSRSSRAPRAPSTAATPRPAPSSSTPTSRATSYGRRQGRHGPGRHLPAHGNVGGAVTDPLRLGGLEPADYRDRRLLQQPLPQGREVGRLLRGLGRLGARAIWSPPTT